MNKNRVCAIIQLVLMTLIILLLASPCLNNANNNILGISVYLGFFNDELSISIAGVVVLLLMASGIGFAITKIITKSDKVRLVMNILMLAVGVLVAVASFLGNKDIIMNPTKQGVDEISLAYTLGFGFIMNGTLSILFGAASILDIFVIGG